MIFLSAGHNILKDRNGKIDPGAISCGFKEAECTVIQRDATLSFLKEKSIGFVKDLDSESLGEYLRRIQTGSGSVVMEYHFNASASPSVTGIETIVADGANRHSIAFAQELNEATVSILKLKNRGVKTEKDTYRGRLGLMRKSGIVALHEICFISNCNDMKQWKKNINELGKKHAEILIKYENLI